ncbi:MAG: M28 family metallopeptidase, partial [Fidelibacterota bacterium]
GKRITLASVLKSKSYLEIGNVIAYLPGNDQQLREEAVIIGAHYDHLGKRNGEIYYGADDDASGTAALIEIAEAFSMVETPPARSIIFAAFGGEEKGTLGSTYYTDNPPFSIEKTAAMLQMDMVGRNGAESYREMSDPSLTVRNRNKIFLFGSAQAKDLESISDSANAEVGLEMVYEPNVSFSAGSDHVAFHKKGIPVIFYFSGFHTDYHKPTDTADKINYEKLERVARLVFITAWKIASREEKLSFDRNVTSVPKAKKRVHMY